MFTLALTYQDIVYFGVLTLAVWTTWRLGLDTGSRRTINYLIQEELLEVEET